MFLANRLTGHVKLFVFVCFVALRHKSTATLMCQIKGRKLKKCVNLWEI